MTRGRRGLPFLPAPLATPRRQKMESSMFDEATAREDIEKVIGTFSRRHLRTIDAEPSPPTLYEEQNDLEVAS